MPKVVEMLQNITKQYGANPLGSVVIRSKGSQPQNSTQPGGKKPPAGSGTGGYCEDNICQEIERTTGGCPQDCR